MRVAAAALCACAAAGGAAAASIPPGCSANLDLLFVLDGSKSIKSDAWQIDLSATKFIADSFTFGCDGGGLEAEMGIIQFSQIARVEQPLTCDKDTFEAASAGLVQMKNMTYTGDALEAAHAEFQKDGRSNSSKVVVLITDGLPCTPDAAPGCQKSKNPVPDPAQVQKAQTWASTLKGDGVVISIAVGNFDAAGLQFIDSISSTPASKYVFNPSNWQQLPAMLNTIIPSICPTPMPAPPPAPPLPSNCNKVCDTNSTCAGGQCTCCKPNGPQKDYKVCQSAAFGSKGPC